MKYLYFIFFLLLSFSVFTQETNILFLDFENPVSNDFDREFFNDTQDDAIRKMIDETENMFLVIAEEDVSHIAFDNGDILRLLADVKNPRSDLQSLSSMPYWDDQLNEIIRDNKLRNSIIASVEKNQDVNIHFITNFFSKEIQDEILAFLINFTLVFDIKNYNDNYSHFSSVLHASYMKPEQEVILLHELLKNE